MWVCTIRKCNFIIKYLTVLQPCAVTHAFLFRKCHPSQLLLILWHRGKTFQNLTKSEVEAPPLHSMGPWAAPSPHTYDCIGLRCSQLFPGSPGSRPGPCWTGGGRFPQPLPESADFFAVVTSVTISAVLSLLLAMFCLSCSPSMMVHSITPNPWVRP